MHKFQHNGSKRTADPSQPADIRHENQNQQAERGQTEQAKSHASCLKGFVLFGHAGWFPTQLENEIRNGVWRVVRNGTYSPLKVLGTHTGMAKEEVWANTMSLSEDIHELSALPSSTVAATATTGSPTPSDDVEDKDLANDAANDAENDRNPVKAILSEL